MGLGARRRCRRARQGAGRVARRSHWGGGGGGGGGGPGGGGGGWGGERTRAWAGERCGFTEANRRCRFTEGRTREGKLPLPS
jgi:hypothetical protein